MYVSYYDVLSVIFDCKKIVPIPKQNKRKTKDFGRPHVLLKVLVFLIEFTELEMDSQRGIDSQVEIMDSKVGMDSQVGTDLFEYVKRKKGCRMVVIWEKQTTRV